jgi:hypothetical protein
MKINGSNVIHYSPISGLLTTEEGKVFGCDVGLVVDVNTNKDVVTNEPNKDIVVKLAKLNFTADDLIKLKQAGVI